MKMPRSILPTLTTRKIWVGGDRVVFISVVFISFDVTSVRSSPLGKSRALLHTLLLYFSVSPFTAAAIQHGFSEVVFSLVDRFASQLLSGEKAKVNLKQCVTGPLPADDDGAADLFANPPQAFADKVRCNLQFYTSLFVIHLLPFLPNTHPFFSFLSFASVIHCLALPFSIKHSLFPTLSFFIFFLFSGACVRRRAQTRCKEVQRLV
jgi:hypothetical protein